MSDKIIIWDEAWAYPNQPEHENNMKKLKEKHCEEFKEHYNKIRKRYFSQALARCFENKKGD